MEPIKGKRQVVIARNALELIDIYSNAETQFRVFFSFTEGNNHHLIPVSRFDVLRCLKNDEYSEIEIEFTDNNQCLLGW